MGQGLVFVKNKSTRKAFQLGGVLLLAALLWCLDAALDAWVFSKVPFSDSLWPGVSHHDIYQRTLLTVIALLSGVAVVFRRERDILRRERELSETRFKLAFDTSPDSVNINRLRDGLYVDTNQGFSNLTGYTKEEVVGKTSAEINIWADMRDRGRLVKGLMECGSVENLEADFRAKDGTTRTCLMSARIIEIRGEPHILSVTRDISERKRAEEALRESETRLKTILENVGAYIFMKDTQCRYTYANRQMCQLLNRTLGEVVGNDDTAFFSESFAEQVRQSDRLVIERGQTVTHEQTDLAATGGVSRTYWTVKLPLRDSSGNVYGLCGISTDISDRKRAEQERESLQAQLAQAQKMESIGRLAGGVAHDFNNMLTVILGQTEMALAGLDASQPVHSNLLAIEEAAERSADLTRQLLAFARKQTVAPRALVLNNAVDGMLQMLRRLIGEEIELVWIPGADLWPVKIDPSQIDQLIANLCVNARDAIADEGRITIETRNIELDREYCSSQAGLLPGAYVLLVVRDNGCGIEKEALKHLFEPFYTTKGTGKGTGLGLATVYGIVRQNRGFIDVYSEPGEGTTFKVFLSRFEGEVPNAKGEEEGEFPQGQGETVLLVEDDETILAMGGTMLEKLGYRVLTANRPSEAMAKARTHVGEIHLLITDVVMPEMNGRVLAHRLEEIRPGLRCLFVSGYNANVIAPHGIVEEGVHFLGKPFSRQALARKIREVLAGGDVH